MCQEKDRRTAFWVAELLLTLGLAGLRGLTVEDECWRSQSDSDYRLDGGVRRLSTTFGFR